MRLVQKKFCRNSVSVPFYILFVAFESRVNVLIIETLTSNISGN